MANKIKGLTIAINGETTGLDKALSGVNKKSRDLQSELRKVERLLKLDPGNTELLAQKQKLLADAVAGTKEKLDTLKVAAQQAQEQLAKGEISEEQFRALEREVIKTEQALKKLEEQSEQFGTVLSQELDAAGHKMKDFGDKAMSAGKSMTMKVTAPILGIGAAAAKVGMDFEESMSKVEAMSGATAEEMEALENAARDAGAATSKSAKESADALGYMALAGWDANTSVAALMPVLRLSEAGNIDLARASSLVTDSMSAMGIEVNDLMGYLDIVAQTARSSNTDIDQMAEAYLKVGGTLRGLNIPLEESALALGLLANAGLKGSEAGTGLSAILLNLTAPTGKAKKALDDLGYSAFKSNGEFKGLETVLFDLKNMTSGMSKEQKNMTLAMVGGKEHVKGLNALLNGLDDSYDGLKASIEGADGALYDVAETMLANNKGSLIELKSALEELALKIYDVMRPAIAWIIDALQKFVKAIDGIPGPILSVIVVIAGLVAAIGPLLMGLGLMSTLMGNGLSLIAKLIPAIKNISVVTGALSKALAFLAANPIVLVVAAVVALIAILVHLWKTNEDFRNAIINAWNKIVEVITSVVEKIKTFFTETIPDAAKALVDWFKELPDKIKQVGVDLIMGLWNGIKEKLDWLKNKVTGVVDTIKGWFTGSKGFDVHSPSKWGETLGENVSAGIARGLVDSMTAISQATNKVVGQAQGGLANMAAPQQRQFGGASNAVTAPQPPVNVTLLIDGKLLARYIHDPLKDENAIRGAVLGT